MTNHNDLTNIDTSAHDDLDQLLLVDPKSEEKGTRNTTHTSNNDSWTLRVRGGDPNDPDEKKRPTDPVGLSRSILHVLAQNPRGYVKVQSVGPVALNIVMIAFRMACEVAERRTNDVVLVLRQSEYTAEIGGKRAKGISTRIFSIPIADAT